MAARSSFLYTVVQLRRNKMQRIFDPRDPVLVASISTTRDARNASRRQERTHEDSHDFREIRHHE
jgi:hypothetical protein